MNDQPAKPLLTPATITRRGPKFEVAVQGIRIGEVPSKASAITLLCKEAIGRNETIVTTVLEGAGRSYLTMTATGHVSPSAAPALGSVKPDLSARPATGDMGTTLQSDDSTRSWVEENLLIGEIPAPDKPRRFSLRRKK